MYAHGGGVRSTSTGMVPVSAKRGQKVRKLESDLKHSDKVVARGITQELLAEGRHEGPAGVLGNSKNSRFKKTGREGGEEKRQLSVKGAS